MSKWIKQFLMAGLAGLIRPKHNRKYSLETKVAAVKAYLSSAYSNQELLQRYRKSRLTIVKRLNGRDSQSMKQTIVELAHQLNGKLKTLTVDHRKEFADFHTIEKLTGTPVYFAHAYSPHERGSNENRNRVLRRFIPKGKPIEELSNSELTQINWYLNSRPLKCLNWHSPIEIFLLNLRQ